MTRSPEEVMLECPLSPQGKNHPMDVAGLRLWLTFFAHRQTGKVHVLPRLFEASSFPEDMHVEVKIDMEVTVTEASSTSSKTIKKSMTPIFSAAQQWPTPAMDLEVPNEPKTTVSITVSVSATFLRAGRAEERSKVEHMEETEKIIEQLIKANSKSLYWCGADDTEKMVWEVAKEVGLRDDIIKKLIPSNASEVLQFVVKR
jgi:hypothetical protein